MKFRFFLIILTIALTITACAKNQQSAMSTDNNLYDFSNRIPLQYTITTDIPVNSVSGTTNGGFSINTDELNSENINVTVAVNTVDGEYPARYDLDCESDGVYEFKGLTEEHVCTYKRNTGKHQISVRGDIQAMYLCHRNIECYMKRGASGDNNCISLFKTSRQEDIFQMNPVISVDSWGDIQWKSMNQFAAHCVGLTAVPAEAPDLSDVSDMSEMFLDTYAFNQSINHWDVSHVTDMSGMFKWANAFNQPLDKWNVSNVKKMNEMFKGTKVFNQPLENWDVSNVMEMREMFSSTYAFNQPLDKWNVSNVKDMNRMFYAAINYKQYPNDWVVPPGESEDMFVGTKVERKAERSPLKTTNVDYIDIADWCRPNMGAQLSAQDWAAASNAFGIKLLKTMTGNTVFSPFSIERSLGMPLEGACLSTADEMLRSLEMPNAKRLSLSGLAVNQALNAINHDTTILEIENGLWPEKSLTLTNDFLARYVSGFGSNISPMDYAHHPEQARASINVSISETTHGRIQDLIPAGSISSDTKLIGTNAVYFKSKWVNSFDEEKTTNMTFYNASGETQVMTMYQEIINGWVCVTDDYAYIDLPFQSARYFDSQRGAYFLRIILPTIDSSHPMENRMQYLHDVENHMASQKGFSRCSSYDVVDLSLPKFKLEPEAFSLSDKLIQMGMKRAFTDNAEFYAMPIDSSKPSNPIPYLVKFEDVYHKAFIEIDETGAEAAAATYTEFTFGDEESEPVHYTFKADHPFLFMLMEKSTGAALFMGRITDL